MNRLLFSTSSHTAAEPALKVVTDLQEFYRQSLCDVAKADNDVEFERIDWTRNNGKNGGGWRYSLVDETHLFNRASINVSAVHYDDQPAKRLRTAIALSAIVHPLPEIMPSMHLHISMTVLRDGSYSMRLMVDLNPAVEDTSDNEQFKAALEGAVSGFADSASILAAGKKQGDHYFYIPALQRHRGITHFYLESYKGADLASDCAHAQQFGEAMISAYKQILEKKLGTVSSDLDSIDQTSFKPGVNKLRYFTLYLYQVLTLDRGTITGLLVHDQNDAGIMGSLPGYIDIALLQSWYAQTPAMQQPLVAELLKVLKGPAAIDSKLENVVAVSVDKKLKIAQAVRSHYQENPDATQYLAKGFY